MGWVGAFASFHFQVFQALQGLEHGHRPHVCRPQVSSCVVIDSPFFLGVYPSMSLVVVLVSGLWVISCLVVFSLESMSCFLISSSLGVFVSLLVSPPVLVLRFFSSPHSVVTSGSLVFVSDVSGRSRVFVLLSSCPWVPQLH